MNAAAAAAGTAVAKMWSSDAKRLSSTRSLSHVVVCVIGALHRGRHRLPMLMTTMTMMLTSS